MAVRTQAIDPTLGIYTLSYQDEQEAPTNNIGERTTGGRYASNYLGARSRWWDLSWQQAILERDGIDAHNRLINDEIANLEDARSNILQGVPQRADSMARSLMMGNTRRLEHNASSGDMRSVTVSTGGGQGGRYGSGRIQPNAYVRSTVAALTQGLDEEPESVARAMAQGREAGQLWQDDAAQNQAAFAYIQNRIGQARTEMMNGGIAYDEAGVAARNYVESQWDSTDGPTKDLWNRFAAVEQQVINDQGGGRRTSVTTREGRDALPEFYNQATGELTHNVWEIDPFMYDQETMVDRIDREILEREAQIRQQASPIERARQIQRQEFGPSITQAWREEPRRLRQREQDSQIEELIAQHLDSGGTWEEIQAIMAGEPPVVEGRAVPRASALDEQGQDMERFDIDPAPVSDITIEPPVSATSGIVRLEGDNTYEYQKQGETWLYRTVGSDEWQDMNGFSQAVRDEAYGKLNDALSRLPPVEAAPEAAPVGAAAVPKPRGEAPAPPSYATGMTDEEIQAVPDQQRTYDVDAAHTQAEEQLNQQQETEANTPDMWGASATQRHNDNILDATVGATARLEKPNQLRRQIDNAENGTPASFARAAMDAWRDMDVSSRPSINDMVDQTAQQFNGIGDQKGRNEAVEYLLASYALETDNNLLG